MRYNNYDTSKIGMLGFLGVLLGALWIFVTVSVYQDEKVKKYDVSVHPGAVTYGTHSSAVMPMETTLVRRSSTPMISSGAIRSYAYSGHASTPSATGSSGFKIHTFSSATLHSIGGGGFGGGGSVGGGGSSQSGTIHYGGSVSVSMPSLAMATPTRTRASSSYSMTEEEASSVQTSRSIGLRRAPSDPGTYEGEQGEDGGKYWMWDGEEWIEQGDIPIGTTKIIGTETYRWNGSEWVLVGDQQDPGVPIGDAPWLWLLLLAGIYAWYKRELHKVSLRGTFLYFLLKI